MKITNHALKRFQQRGINRELIDLIMMFGEPIEKPGGTTEYRLTPRAKTEAQSELKRQLTLVERACNKGVLVDDKGDTLITAYHLM